MLRVGVVTFPGSNCESETLRAIARVGAEPVELWHQDTGLKGVDVVILPGGFSYGDYLRSGAIARFSPIMASSGIITWAARSSTRPRPSGSKR